MQRAAFSTEVQTAEKSAKQAEREWHDAFYRTHASEEYPPTVQEFRERFKRVHLTPFFAGGWSWWADPRREALDSVGDVRGLRVLDYGCGSGALGMYLSTCGAHVSGFDLSQEGTRVANAVAGRYGLSAQFDQMDAEDLRYEGSFFDLVIGFGVLHHVIKYPRASTHLLRVMKPGGKAIFIETLWDNPVLNLIRRLTTEDADAGDAHLTERSIRDFASDFSQTRLEKRHLVYMSKRLAALPECNLEAPIRPRPFWTAIKSIDEKLLRFKLLRRYCGEVIIFLQK
jgi:2-polyprenyl-3-methyl-5-hydroxy-6-metoxy-1,4-benzoquinol methylase